MTRVGTRVRPGPELHRHPRRALHIAGIRIQGVAGAPSHMQTMVIAREGCACQAAHGRGHR
jgi:hypothetical protein